MFFLSRALRCPQLFRPRKGSSPSIMALAARSMTRNARACGTAVQLLRWLTPDLSYSYTEQTSTDRTRVYPVNNSRMALVGRS